jgi:hypothetical protein
MWQCVITYLSITSHTRKENNSHAEYLFFLSLILWMLCAVQGIWILTTCTVPIIQPLSLFYVLRHLNFNQKYSEEMYNSYEVQHSLESDFKLIVSANWFLCLPHPTNLTFHPEHVTSYNRMESPRRTILLGCGTPGKWVCYALMYLACLASTVTLRSYLQVE